MPTLKIIEDAGTPRFYSVHKLVTTLGRAPGCDVVLSGTGVKELHAQLAFDGRDFQLEAADRDVEVTVNGKPRRRGRLAHGDRLGIGSRELLFSMFAEEPSLRRRPEAGETGTQITARGARPELAGLQALQAFSQRLMGSQSLDELLRSMLTDLVGLTHAETGMVLLAPELSASGAVGAWQLRAAHNIGADAGPGVDWARVQQDGQATQVSDSILERVLATRQAVLVSDAMNDTAFRGSESVLALRLSSVMCAPLLHNGTPVGIIYLGNAHVKHLFDRSQLDLLEIFASQASLLVQNAMMVSSLREDKAKLTTELRDKRFGEIIGACPGMLAVFQKVQKVAATDVSVLITGETGTGKELIARELHRRSPRADGPFVTINCGAIPENLIESELFGHVRGAFTGAVATRAGKFQLAHGGTLFLDEIGELPLALQVKLLRALQERIVTRVGDSKPEKVDIRVLAATNRDLEVEVREGRFREDLFYRLNVVTVWLPPLRERGEDVVVLAKALLAKYAGEAGSQAAAYAPAALIALRRYGWPGNVRQLENRIRRAVVLCEGSQVTPADLDLEESQLEPILPLEKAKEEFQRRYVLQALERNGGNRTQTARDLGVDPRTIFRYLEREQSLPSLETPPGQQGSSGGHSS